ncbi:hypothetical protein [Hymenobacter wooponensis]|uniref:Nucleotide-diphospho-sugar transferase domain-containing protein n=1 Tax=Hymenobacter wooponensis TaxID=1525360 RepID=A0A4Z0MUQ3_9BACT|nr:hypothetical protein [Hymenobacter wooponensis]TGD82987.1 hypothetical protein EU557_04200 [Hymenobacter wooponensis]
MYLLVTQSFGKESEYRRAVFAVLSFWARYSGDKKVVKTVIFTDNSTFFQQYLSDIDVHYVHLTPEKMKSMRGRIDFLHRMKIALIEETFLLYPEATILYIDSDTFFIEDATLWMKSFTPGKSFMHLLEYPFESCREAPLPAGQTQRAFLNLIESKTFITSQGVESYTAQQASWNAGVMGLPYQVASWLPDVYSLTDEFYPPSKSHGSEQSAFSLILQTRTQLEPCDQYVYHYWHRVQKEIIDSLLPTYLNKQFQSRNIEKKLYDIKKYSTSLPILFATHHLAIKDHAIQSFNEKKYKLGYYYSFKLLCQFSIDMAFLKDLLYHSKQFFAQSK